MPWFMQIETYRNLINNGINHLSTCFIDNVDRWFDGLSHHWRGFQHVSSILFGAAGCLPQIWSRDVSVSKATVWTWKQYSSMKTIHIHPWISAFDALIYYLHAEKDILRYTIDKMPCTMTTSLQILPWWRSVFLRLISPGSRVKHGAALCSSSALRSRERWRACWWRWWVRWITSTQLGYYIEPRVVVVFVVCIEY